MVQPITQLLATWQQGDQAAGDALLSSLYGELKSLAAHRLMDEGSGHTLQPTALVHEAYEKLTRLERIDWQGRAHFLAMAARVMREILIDHARGKRAAKRDWGQRVTVSGFPGGEGAPINLLDLDQHLQELAAFDEAKGQVVELRFFGGLSIEETAEAMQVSTATVKRHWQVARAWLYDRLASDQLDP